MHGSTKFKFLLRVVDETDKLIHDNLNIVHTTHFVHIYLSIIRPTLNALSVGLIILRSAVLLLQQCGHVLVDVCNVEL